MRSSRAIIHLDNLAYNYNNLRKKAGNRPVMCVVKADAYGHGMVKCVEKFESLVNPPEYYGVALTEEAVELRKSGVTSRPILIFGPFDSDDITTYHEDDLTPTITDVSNIKFLSDYSGKVLKVHINIDTGMGRLGISYLKAFEMISKLSENKNVQIDGIYTHLACSDEHDKSYTKLQLMRFGTIVEKLKKHKIKYGIAHAANSGGVIDHPDSYFDMIRPGISLYGYYPSNDTGESVSLKPVMELRARISSVKEIPTGESVSYGRKYIANKPIISGTVAFGYADGYNRLLTNNARAKIGNKIVKQIGRVTMDRIMFDVSEIDTPVGQEIVLMGYSGEFRFTAEEWANICGTIPYEITCNISRRVPREYIG
ncbi:MAG: alanine racemase [Melioribacteraceae bacterium]|nr:MAG: alanine racemase [Melioribacteraceae bacterium]